MAFSSSESDLEDEELAWKKEEGPNIRTNGERELDLGEELKEEEGGENQEKQEEEEEEAEDEEEEEEEGEISEEVQDEGDSSDGGCLFLLIVFRNDSDKMGKVWSCLII